MADHVVQLKAAHLVRPAAAVEAPVVPPLTATATATEGEAAPGAMVVAVAEVAVAAEAVGAVAAPRDSRDDRDRQQQQQQQSKKRPRPEKPAPECRLCSSVGRGEPCSYGEGCKYAHDTLAFLQSKPPDLGPTCYQYETFGFCPNGLMCRFGAQHIDFVKGLNMSRPAEAGGVIKRTDINLLSKELQHVLRKKSYGTKPAATGASSSSASASASASASVPEFNSTPLDGRVKLVDFRNKVYIAPLTTVGNLPFRRIMKDFGADITCGEMAMSNNLINGQASEWALLRRHSSEDVFGVQIAGSNPGLMRDICKVLDNEISSDYVDINCGCPIDILCDKGCGAALMTKPSKLCEIVSAMTKALPSRSVTVKIRTGWNENDPTAHKLVPQIQKTAKGRVAAIFVHGRSRLQRYHRLANWDYVAEVARSQNPDLPLIPIIGNGDIFSYQDWHGHQALLSEKLEGDAESMGLCSCAMVGRGAIIKPWLSTELKEQRLWDISAGERLDMLKRFCSYGMEHWGSDQQGINATRRFLLEWLSYLHRYVPVGLMEYPEIAQKMQQRPPHYFGRCDLETLLGSSNSNDWVKISTMLLGPVPDEFSFKPKHASNSYGPEAVMGGGVEDSSSNG